MKIYQIQEETSISTSSIFGESEARITLHYNDNASSLRFRLNLHEQKAEKGEEGDEDRLTRSEILETGASRASWPSPHWN